MQCVNLKKCTLVIFNIPLFRSNFTWNDSDLIHSLRFFYPEGSFVFIPECFFIFPLQSQRKYLIYRSRSCQQIIIKYQVIHTYMKSNNSIIYADHMKNPKLVLFWEIEQLFYIRLFFYFSAMKRAPRVTGNIAEYLMIIFRLLCIQKDISSNRLLCIQ